MKIEVKCPHCGSANNFYEWYDEENVMCSCGGVHGRRVPIKDLEMSLAS